MDSWGKWLETVMDNVEPTPLDNLVLPDDDCDLIQEKEHWTRLAANRLVHSGGSPDIGGAAWPTTFQAHMRMREQFQVLFGEPAPSVEALRNQACQQSSSNPFQSPSWHELLPVRDADVLHMHTSLYLHCFFYFRDLYHGLSNPICH